MSASRWLFSATSSPGSAGTRKRSTRGPSSSTVIRTGTVAGAPPAGQRHLLRADDAALVLDVERHRWPSNPRCATTTSTSSVVPLSAVRGVLTRPI